MTQTSQPTPMQDHPVPAAVALLRAQLDELAETPVWSLTQATSAQVLIEVTRLAAQIASLELRLAAQARSVVVEDLNGATSTASWWAHQTQTTRDVAHRKVALAQALGTHPLTATALARGAVLADQAAVVVESIEALPADVGPTVRAAAEERLLDLAREHDAKALARLGRKVLQVVAPEVGEAHEAAELAREERDASAAARFTMVDDGHGKVHGRFTLSSVHGAMLRKALLAFAAPKHLASLTGAAPALRPSAEKLGQAFTEYVERYPVDRLPEAGGVAATVVITLGLDDLVAGLDTGEALTAGQARRLACEAGVIPAVLGGPSQILDLGRQTRFHTRAQRIALGLRDGGCTTEGCDWPPGLCHAHHDDPWHRGGPTDLKHARLLCPRHHARAHDPAYDQAKLPTGKVSFTRRE